MSQGLSHARSPDIPRASILGVLVSAIGMRQALETIASWVEIRDPHYVTVTPAHAVMDAYEDPELRRIFNASGMTTPDGMAIVWLLKLRGHRSVSRVYGPDLMLETCRAGLESGYRHFLYGGAEGVAEALAGKLSARFPGLQIVGTHTPPFRDLTEDEDRSVVELINTAQPGYRLGRAQHAQAGTLDGGAPGPDRGAGDDWRRCGVRLPLRDGSRRRRAGCSAAGWSGCSAWRPNLAACGPATGSTRGSCSSLRHRCWA